ncbi:hypothetical protein GA0115254_110547 [Streptomyces sp. Ncost-T10-10d]|nr:hypothetical protein GA0115254_110547 [Streptomyces sp. Ncost-T10-10d]
MDGFAAAVVDTAACRCLDPLITIGLSAMSVAAPSRPFYFSAVHRKVVTPNDFTDLAQVGDRLRAFEDRYNATAQPFQ